MKPFVFGGQIEIPSSSTTHIPNHGEQMVRYYGFYSNASRGLRQKENKDALILCVLEPDENKKPNRNWARLIQKIMRSIH